MRRRAEAAKAHEVTKLEELRARRPERALAADRRRDRRVPVPVRRARRGHPGGRSCCWRTSPGAAARRASTWCWPARTCPASRRSGAVRRSSSSSCCGSRCRGPAGCWPSSTTPRSTCRAGTPWSTTSPGIKHGNEIVRIPNATARGSVDEVQRAAARRLRRRARPQPRLFDGSRSPRLDDLVAGLPPPTACRGALVGQCIDVAGSAAVVAAAGRAGPQHRGARVRSGEEAVRVLGAAAGSLAGEYPPGGLDVVIAPLVAEAAEPAAPAGRARRPQPGSTVRDGAARRPARAASRRSPPR